MFYVRCHRYIYLRILIVRTSKASAILRAHNGACDVDFITFSKPKSMFKNLLTRTQLYSHVLMPRSTRVSPDLKPWHIPWRNY